MIQVRSPHAYRTGGAWMCQFALDACDIRALEPDTAWPNAINGGPIDAPDYVPTGAVKVERGFIFFELQERETR